MIRMLHPAPLNIFGGIIITGTIQFSFITFEAFYSLPKSLFPPSLVKRKLLKTLSVHNNIVIN